MADVLLVGRIARALSVLVPIWYFAAMPTAEEDFLVHAASAQEYLSLQLSEADTRAYLIDPVLHILGYQTVADIRREVPVPATKEFLDYELRVDGRPLVIVEAKALRHPITDQHAAQCVQYASVHGVRWCLITNGFAWAVYDAHARGPLADKRVTIARLDGDAGAAREAWAVLSLFSREFLVPRLRAVYEPIGHCTLRLPVRLPLISTPPAASSRCRISPRQAFSATSASPR